MRSFFRFWALHLPFCAVYFLAFFLGGSVRFSPHGALLLKWSGFFVLQFCTVLALPFLDTVHCPRTLKDFRESAKRLAVSALIFGILSVAAFGAGLSVIRMLVVKEAFAALDIVLFFLLAFFTGTIYVLPLWFFMLEKRKPIGLKEAFKKSLQKFTTAPFITAVFFICILLCKLISIFTMFLLPTWLLGEKILISSMKRKKVFKVISF